MEWISVNVELPPLDELVLLTDGEDVHPGKRVDSGRLPYNFVEDDFDSVPKHEDDVMYNSFYANIVTHWMPLPEPPKS